MVVGSAEVVLAGAGGTEEETARVVAVVCQAEKAEMVVDVDSAGVAVDLAAEVDLAAAMAEAGACRFHR